MNRQILLHTIELFAFLALFAVYGLILAPFYYIIEFIELTHILGLSAIIVCLNILYGSLRTWWKYRGACLPEENAPHLHQYLGELSTEFNTTKPRLVILETPVPNAYATDALPTKPIVILTTGLIDVTNEQELQAVIAHEISHIKSYDVFFMMVMASLISVLRRGHNFTRQFVLGPGGPIETIVFLVPFLVTRIALVIGHIVFFTVSRVREFVADRDAAEATSPYAMQSALVTISNQMAALSELERQRFPGDKPLCIIPLDELTSRLFQTHPTTQKRIDKLEKLK